ncbi:NADP-dependent oxidoreductase [Weissella viridescens]|uniref:NADP-dependent oxidoreductase n=1 Tax=Weissella viridescens TaxID=1629 RepID=A0A3P2RLC8_WEIVI|nr:NADP-dependent oxidoreductase [Weissella viridescens]RRG18472.1 NADP-dependent oxidoreductase [Weissella viridescens]
MLAIKLNQFGGVDELKEVHVDRPTPAAKQVLIENHAVAIDPYDVKFVMGLMGEGDKLPLVPGSSVVGEIVAIGADVTDFKVGDRVAANRHHQTYAEYVPVGQSALAKVPDSISDATAVASVLGAATGYQMVVENLDIQAGEKVLIQGGSGSVGSAAIQAALNRGAEVYATSSPAHFDYLESFGDVHPVDYHTAYEKDLSDFDAVLDTVGGTTTVKSAQVLKAGGRLVNLSSDPQLDELSERYHITAKSAYLFGKGALLNDLFADIAAGRITIKIADTKPFNQANLQADHALMREESPVGKLVLEF